MKETHLIAKQVPFALFLCRGGTFWHGGVRRHGWGAANRGSRIWRHYVLDSRLSASVTLDPGGSSVLSLMNSMGVAGYIHISDRDNHCAEDLTNKVSIATWPMNQWKAALERPGGNINAAEEPFMEDTEYIWTKQWQQSLSCNADRD